VQKRLGAIGVVALCLASCHEAHNGQGGSPGIVGAWVVKIPDAPFPLHLFVFHSDGTVEQSNPDAGDPTTSDSNLMGAWRIVGDEYRGKVVEITADRTTHRFATRGEISFELKVQRLGTGTVARAREAVNVLLATFQDGGSRYLGGDIDNPGGHIHGEGAFQH
jgi:hypothetical protein